MPLVQNLQAAHAPLTTGRTSGKIPTATLAYFARIRFQLFWGILFSVVLPTIIRLRDYLPGITVASVNNTMIGASLAIVVGYFIMRQFSAYTGFQAGDTILMAFVIPFLLVIAAFFLLRLDYSRYLFAISFILAMVWFLGLNYLISRSTKLVMHVVPGGNVDTLQRIASVNWIGMPAPPAEVNGMSAVVVDLRFDHSSDWERFIADCTLAGVPVFHTKQLAESLTGKVDIEHLSENTFGSLLPNMLYIKLKSLADILLAIAALPLLALVVLVVGPLIVWKSGWPLFFKQKRVGHGGRIFSVYKFRTMVNSSAIQGRDAAITTSGDSRITPVGKFLRKYRIDELPQIFNILRGQMSWIGPRPEALSLSNSYEQLLPFYRYRHVVKPGITGWAQVNQGHVTNPEQVLEKLHFDFF